MPWERVKDVMEQRVEFVVRANQPGACLAQLCREFGISRKCGHGWLKRYRQAGSLRALEERSRRPHRSPTKTPQPLEERVVALRGEQGWGARKIQALLAREGVALKEWTINRILSRRGLVRPRAVQGKATGRFERAECNQLHQLDFKGEYRLREGCCYPLSLLDDHSRYLVGLWALPNQQTQPVRSVLEGLFREQGVPEALLLDRGVPWWSQSSGHGLTRLSVWLLEQDIELIFGAPRHPQTRGKVERFHRTLKERTAHEGPPQDLVGWQQWAKRFRTEYNQVRPHQALGMRTPAQVYRPQHLHPYQEAPREYPYRCAKTQRLDAGGFLNYRGRRHFVCEALATQRVGIDEVDGLVVVRYRAMAIREIDLRTGRTRSLALPAAAHRVLPMSC